MTPMEKVTCECGKRESLEKAVIDADGNWSCLQCQAEGVKQSPAHLQFFCCSPGDCQAPNCTCESKL